MFEHRITSAEAIKTKLNNFLIWRFWIVTGSDMTPNSFDGQSNALKLGGLHECFEARHRHRQ